MTLLAGDSVGLLLPQWGGREPDGTLQEGRGLPGLLLSQASTTFNTLHRADTPPFSILILHSVRNTELHLHLKNINNTAKMVADSLIYHPSVAHYLKYVATTVGRDKLLRTIQYFSRFYAWYLYRTNGTPGEIAPFDAIKKQFGLARKLMRVGKNVEHFKAAAIAADSKSLDPVIKYCAVGRQLGYAGYLSLDAVTYLDAAGIRKSPMTQRLAKEAYRCWMFGLLFSAVSGTYSLYNLRQQQKRISKEDGEGVVAAKRIEKYIPRFRPIYTFG